MSLILDALDHAEAVRRAPVGPHAMERLSADVALLGEARTVVANARTLRKAIAALDALAQSRRDEFSAMASAHCCAVLDRECSPSAAPPS